MDKLLHGWPHIFFFKNTDSLKKCYSKIIILKYFTWRISRGISFPLKMHFKCVPESLKNDQSTLLQAMYAKDDIIFFFICVIIHLSNWHNDPSFQISIAWMLRMITIRGQWTYIENTRMSENISWHNTLKVENGCHFADDVFKCSFLREKSYTLPCSIF